jgi:hypothetical protein
VARQDITEGSETAQALEVAAGEFVVATASAADIQAYAPLSALLRRVGHAFGIDAAFVSDHHARRETDALQELYGMRLLGAETADRFRFEAVPVVTGDGAWRGTLCCRMPAAAGPSEHEALHSVAQLIANCFAEAAAAA